MKQKWFIKVLFFSQFYNGHSMIVGNMGYVCIFWVSLHILLVRAL